MPGRPGPPCRRTGCSAVPVGGLGSLDDGGGQAFSGLVCAGDSYAGEPHGQQQVTVLLLGEGAAAADPLLSLGQLSGVNAVVGGDVADAQPTAGPEHPKDLGEDPWLIGGQGDDAGGEDHIDLSLRQWEVLDVAL